MGGLEAAPADAALQVRGLRRSYGDVDAVVDLDLEVHPGEVVALLGRNGAGKSTTVRTITGLDRRYNGEVLVFGSPPDVAARQRLIGYCGQEVAVYPTLTVERNLHYPARLAGLAPAAAGAAVDELLVTLGLDEVRTRRANALSGGQKRRLHLAMALVGTAPLLVLDEPTAGVDVDSREAIVALVRSLADRGRAVLYTSHDLAEVERLCDRVVIVHGGRVLASGSIDELSGEVGQLLRFDLASADEVELARKAIGDRARRRGLTGIDVQLGVDEDPTHLLEISRCEGWDVRRSELVAPGLESIFLRLTDADPR